MLQTPLLAAVQADAKVCVQALLDKRANYQVKTPNGRNALHLNALGVGSVIDLFIKTGLKLDSRDKDDIVSAGIPVVVTLIKGVVYVCPDAPAAGGVAWHHIILPDAGRLQGRRIRSGQEETGLRGRRAMILRARHLN